MPGETPSANALASSAWPARSGRHGIPPPISPTTICAASARGGWNAVRRLLLGRTCDLANAVGHRKGLIGAPAVVAIACRASGAIAGISASAR
jgi:hypothetical protein